MILQQGGHQMFARIPPFPPVSMEKASLTHLSAFLPATAYLLGSLQNVSCGTNRIIS